ncbi:superoxide dismutase 1 copper chaperone [Diutina catenulata]
MTNQFEIVFNVDMTCQSCVDSVSQAVDKVPGIDSYKVDLANKQLITNGSAAPSTIVEAVQSTGKDAIIRGTGKPDSAAVCILENFTLQEARPVKGMARMVAVAENDLVVDLTLNGVPKGTYYPTIRSSGNLADGALSTGSELHKLDPIEATVPSDTGYSGQSFSHVSTALYNLIGRSMVVSQGPEVKADSLCGVIARSAGAWQNDKMVCSCTGKTVWEERVEARAKGIKN